MLDQVTEPETTRPAVVVPADWWEGYRRSYLAVDDDRPCMRLRMMAALEAVDEDGRRL